MLVLTRKLMEKLYIGDNVVVTVVRLEGGQVRLGIEAPREVNVVRAELIEGKAAPKAEGAEPTPPSPMGRRLRPRPAEARGTDSQRREPSR